MIVHNDLGGAGLGGRGLKAPWGMCALVEAGLNKFDDKFVK